MSVIVSYKKKHFAPKYKMPLEKHLGGNNVVKHKCYTNSKKSRHLEISFDSLAMQLVLRNWHPISNSFFLWNSFSSCDEFNYFNFDDGSFKVYEDMEREQEAREQQQQQEEQPAAAGRRWNRPLFAQ